jgi:NhaA family Na+:H+ antiporter
MAMGPHSSQFPRGSWPEVSRITALLRREIVGGALLLAAAFLASLWGNAPWFAPSRPGCGTNDHG